VLATLDNVVVGSAGLAAHHGEAKLPVAQPQRAFAFRLDRALCPILFTLMSDLASALPRSPKR
jgi:hypothetical protein